MLCWICNINEADSREHRVKKTDLKNMYPIASQSSPIYHRRNGKKKKEIISINSDRFKYPNVICEDCNNNKTQKHDKAWEQLSSYLTANWDIIEKNKGFDINQIFSNNKAEKLIFVQLYFVKLFGCKIVESKAKINLDSFSKSIYKNKENTKIFISFRASKNGYSKSYSINSDIEVSEDINGIILYAHWFYTVGAFTVDLIYTEDAGKIKLNGLKRPSEMKKFVALSNQKIIS